MNQPAQLKILTPKSNKNINGNSALSQFRNMTLENSKMSIAEILTQQGQFNHENELDEESKFNPEKVKCMLVLIKCLQFNDEVEAHKLITKLNLKNGDDELRDYFKSKMGHNIVFKLMQIIVTK